LSFLATLPNEELSKRSVSHNGSSTRGPWWEGSLPGDPEGWVKTEGSRNGHLSPLGPRWGTRRGGVVYRGLRKKVKERCVNATSLSLYGSSVRRTWTEGSFSVNAESYLRLVKEGFGNGTTLSL